MINLDALQKAAEQATQGKRSAKMTNQGWMVMREGEAASIAMLYTPSTGGYGTLEQADAEAGANAALVAMLDPRAVLEIVRRLRAYEEITAAV